MSEGASMFTGGPPLVKAATGEDVTKDELGGPKSLRRDRRAPRTTSRPTTPPRSRSRGVI
jgi:hypothetical protein